MKVLAINALLALPVCALAAKTFFFGVALLSNGPKTEVSQVGGDDLLKSEAHDWIVRLTSGGATTADAKAFNAWCEISPAHAQAFAEAKDLWHALRNAVRTLQKL